YRSANPSIGSARLDGFVDRKRLSRPGTRRGPGFRGCRPKRIARWQAERQQRDRAQIHTAGRDVGLTNSRLMATQADRQPGIGETYISTGSVYLCAVALLPLGLPASDPFWAAAAEPWTAARAWSGKPFPIDKAIEPR